jgi:probable phosphoglycerate mutase
MTVLLLIRHAENDYVKKGLLAGRLPGVNLNEKGQQQARQLADKLGGKAIIGIYSSPLERARQTAEPIAQSLNLQVIIREGLIEVDFGEWQGKKLKALARLKAWKVVQFFPSLARFPGGESFQEAQLRVCQEIQWIANQHQEKEVVACVMHADGIRLALAYFLGMPLDAFQRLSAAPASISALQINPIGARILSINYDISFNLPDK